MDGNSQVFNPHQKNNGPKYIYKKDPNHNRYEREYFSDDEE